MPISGVKTFTPKLQAPFTIYTTSPISSLFAMSPTDVATAYLNTQHGIPLSQIKITDSYTDPMSGTTHVYARQVVGGTEIANALANINVNPKGQVISSSQSFVQATVLPLAKRDSLSLQRAFQALAMYVGTEVDDKTMASVTVDASGPGYTLNGLPEFVAVLGQATIESSIIQRSDRSLAPTWHIVLQQAEHWWSAHVNTQTGGIEAINDWVSHQSPESYNVYPRTIDSPSTGSRQLVVNPADTRASPKGWVTANTTAGNNVWAQTNPTGGVTWRTNHRPNAPACVFNFTLDLAKSPSTYQDAAVTQLFYTVNTMHDLSFVYGFTEAAGNFQDVNYSGQGKDGDYVVAFAQDGSGTNNANFATPPDGQHGVMRMYTWTVTTPNRDGDLEQDIVAHEFTHGISNRLTGGPANVDCLNDGQAGGMGEGWSDAVANILRLKKSDSKNTDMIMGEYVYQRGIRNYAYSTSLKTNPVTYAFLARPDYQEVHAIGEVWAEMLYEVMWALIERNGVAEDLFDHDLTKGNSLLLQILFDGMKLQPCNPSFVNARDAILQAESILTGGKNRMPAYHSSYNSAANVRVINGLPLLPLLTRTRGPAPYADPSMTHDAIDEALDLFRPNSLFKNFEIKGPGDRLLIYIILFTSQCLNKLRPATTHSEATKALYSLAVTNVVIPADASFPLHAMYPAVAERSDSDVLRQYLGQVRQEVALRLVARVYTDPGAAPSKWWLSFQKRHFMGKSMVA
ncbi:hypothetical protein GGI20_005140 [Coemansia sp. BCRC 34301]|nr:hypothetical protein GGI20_005140 [Coemansia sp. BCRC 34301]